MVFVRLYSTAPTASADNKMWVKLSTTPPAPPQDDLAGTWVFNNTLDFTAHGNILLKNIPLAFISNGNEYTAMTIGAGTTMTNALVMYGMTRTYRGSSFLNTAFQTVEISTTYDELVSYYANAELVLAFLQVNATRQ